jgi:DNA-binding MarR family transcriptional regulator
MRTMEDVMPLFLLMGSVLTRFCRIERRPVQFPSGPTLYPAEVHMLAALAVREDATVTGLAACCGVTKGAVSQMLKRLEGKGLLQREDTAVRLTPLGQEMHQAHMAFHQEHDREFVAYLRSLPEAEFAVCLELCRRMQAWVEKYPT